MTDNLETQVVYDKLELVKAEIAKVLTGSPMPVRQYVKHLLKSQGKYIRATAILASAIQEDNSIADDAITAAAAIELVHLATLVHDDVIDNADLRRGVVTLQKKYGQKIAVICGDYLFVTAISLCSNIKILIDHQLFEYIRLIAVGELNQYINNHNYDLEIETYLDIIGGKTAKLFEASFLVGALISNESDDNIEKLKLIGYKIGLIFQLIDDCGNFSETINIAKKPVLSDLDQGVITLPVIYTFKNNPQALKDFKKGKLKIKDINKLVKKEKGIELTKQKAMEYYAEIELLLVSMDMNQVKKYHITQILNNAIKI